MTEEKNEKAVVASQSDPGFVRNMSRQVLLILRLMGDKRVNIFLKALPFGALVYLVAPDLVPFILDDAIVMGVGIYAFIELCPPDVVEEHRRALWGGEEPEEVMDVDYAEDPEEGGEG
jgi:hypothetical protein